MKNRKKQGISLIVLILTIIVIVILAVSVILSIANNNPIENAKKAAFQNYMSSLKEELILYIQNKMLNTNGEYSQEKLNADSTSLSENGIVQEGKNIKDVLSSIDKKYLEDVKIINGELVYTSEENISEYNWAKEILEGKKTNYVKEETNDLPNIKIENALSGSVENLKIYGNNVGDLVTDESDTNYGKYKIQLKVNGKNIYDHANVYPCRLPETKTENGYYREAGNSIYFPTYSTLKKYMGQTATISFDFETGEAGTFQIYKYQNNGIIIDFKAISVKMEANTKKRIVATGTVVQINTNSSYTPGEVIAYNNGYTGSLRIENMQFELGDKATEYEPYTEEIYNIYLNEPLRKLDNAVDYIDFKEGKVIRNVEEVNGELKKLSTPKEEKIELPDILNILTGTKTITVETTETPSKIETIYNKEK